MHTSPAGARHRLNPAAQSRAASDRRRGIQIGPRIRVGGSIGAVGQNVKNAVTKGVTDVGHAVGKVADNPLTQAALIAALTATGVGAIPAAGIMAATRGGGALLKPGGNIGEGVKGAVQGAVAGGVAGKAGQLLRGGGLIDKLKGVATLGGHLPSIGGTAPGGGISDASVGGDGSTPVDGGSPGIFDYLKKAGMSVLGGGGNGNGTTTGGGQGTGVLDKLLMGGSIAAGAADEVQKHNLQNKATDYATGAFDAKAPMRAQALAKLAAPSRPDLSAISADPGNVYDRARRARMLAASATAAPTSPTPVTGTLLRRMA